MAVSCRREGKTAWAVLLVSALLIEPEAVQAQFTYLTNSDRVSVTITGYTNSDPVVTIPTHINGLVVTGIGSNAFYDAGVTSVAIPDSVTDIGAMAFDQCSNLDSVIIPDSVIRIGALAFSFCSSLTNAYIGDGVTEIGSNAFSSCYDLPSIAIPASVTNIGIYAFTECFRLAAITVATNNPSYCSFNEVLFDKNQTRLIECPAHLGAVSFTIPGSVTNIESYAFYECSVLTNVTIPDSVTRIGIHAFEFCDGLKSITIPSSVISIGMNTFDFCEGLTTVTIPGSVTNIGPLAFVSDASLAGVFFGGNAPSIDSTAFASDNTTIYYLPGTTGWYSPFAGLAAVLWNPVIQAGDGNFGVRSNQFGFDVTGTSNIPIVVERCTNLANPNWSPLVTHTLTSGLFYFSDPVQTNNSRAFYRISPP
jgi:hypothetical protein